jgi:hypothetical protein
MNTKSLSFVFGAFLIALLTLTLVSASISITTGTETLTKSKNSTYFIIKNNNQTSATNVNVGSFGSITDRTHTLTIATIGSGNIAIANNSEYRVNVSYSGDISNFDYGTFSTSLNVTEGSTIINVPLTFSSSYCSAGEKNTGYFDLDIDYEVIEGLGEDEDWYPGDKIEVTVNVDNNEDEDLDDLVLSWCLYDEDAKKCILEDEEESFDVDEDEDYDVVFTIDLDPDEIDKDNDDYSLIVKVYGDSSDYDEEDLCNEYIVDNINLVLSKHFVTLKDVEMPETTQCGSTVDITGEAWNIGKRDEENVYLILYNKDIGLNNRLDLGDIDSFESKKFNFEFQVPNNASAKTHTVEFRVYNEDDEMFESEDDESSYFTFPLKVESCQSQITPLSATITAKLSDETSRAIIGEQVIIEATIKNTGATQRTFTLAVSGNSDWSNLADIDPESFTLGAGESKTISIYLDISTDAETGEKEFIIRAASSGQLAEQKVRLTLEKGFSANALINYFKENWLIYLIVLVNIILIIAIIIVVASIVRKSSKD